MKLPSSIEDCGAEQVYFCLGIVRFRTQLSWSEQFDDWIVGLSDTNHTRKHDCPFPQYCSLLPVHSASNRRSWATCSSHR